MSVKDGTASWEVDDMVKNCYGIPLKCYPNDQMKCNCCFTVKTSWYCVGCKRWLCMERRDTNKGKGKGKGNKAEKENRNDCEPTKKERKIEVYSHCVKGKVKTFARCCYHKVQEARCEKIRRTWSRF